MLKQVFDGVTRPPSNDRYKNLKNKLLEQFGRTVQYRLDQLLSEMGELGEKRPSQLLSEMRHLYGPGVSDTMVEKLWSKWMPEQVRVILQASPGDLQQRGSLADKIIEVMDTRSVNLVSSPLRETPSVSDHFERRLYRLEDKYYELQQMPRKQRARKSSQTFVPTELAQKPYDDFLYVGIRGKSVNYSGQRACALGGTPTQQKAVRPVYQKGTLPGKCRSPCGWPKN